MGNRKAGQSLAKGQVVAMGFLDPSNSFLIVLKREGQGVEVNFQQ